MVVVNKEEGPWASSFEREKRELSEEKSGEGKKIDERKVLPRKKQKKRLGNLAAFTYPSKQGGRGKKTEKTGHNKVHKKI